MTILCTYTHTTFAYDHNTYLHNEYLRSDERGRVEQLRYPMVHRGRRWHNTGARYYRKSAIIRRIQFGLISDGSMPEGVLKIQVVDVFGWVVSDARFGGPLCERALHRLAHTRVRWLWQSVELAKKYVGQLRLVWPLHEMRGDPMCIVNLFCKKNRCLDGLNVETISNGSQIYSNVLINFNEKCMYNHLYDEKGLRQPTAAFSRTRSSHVTCAQWALCTRIKKISDEGMELVALDIPVVF